jgi:hypothetical protein
VTDLHNQRGALRLPRTGLGLFLRDLRRTAGLTLDQVGARCHITRKGLCSREIHGVALPAAALIEHLDALDFDVYAVRRQRPGCRPTGTGWPATPDRRTT